MAFIASFEHEFPAESGHKILAFEEQIKITTDFCELIPLYGRYMKHLGKRCSIVLNLYLRGLTTSEQYRYERDRSTWVFNRYLVELNL